MTMTFKFILSGLLVLSSAATYASDICLSCDIGGLPSSKMFVEMEKLAKNDKLKGFGGPAMKVRSISSEVDPDPTGNYEAYCMKFSQIEASQMPQMLREIDATTYPIDTYFTHSLCEPDAYGPTVKCPMLHKAADAPTKNEKKIETLWNYYSVKRKQPELFTEAINIPNSKGQTLLDYIEYWTVKPSGYSQEEINGPVKRIIAMLCERGGVYKTSTNKACPTK